VSIADAWPRWGEPFTVDDLDRMPDDGRRYELIDGMLIVSPDLDRPSVRAFELDGSAYTEIAHVTGGDSFDSSTPFHVAIVPEQLVAKLRRR
jgi:hypothetical protein